MHWNNHICINLHKHLFKSMGISMPRGMYIFVTLSYGFCKIFVVGSGCRIEITLPHGKILLRLFFRKRVNEFKELVSRSRYEHATFPIYQSLKFFRYKELRRSSFPSVIFKNDWHTHVKFIISFLWILVQFTTFVNIAIPTHIVTAPVIFTDDRVKYIKLIPIHKKGAAGFRSCPVYSKQSIYISG